MIRALRHDFYILFHSPFIIACMLAGLLFAFFGPISSALTGGSDLISFEIATDTQILAKLVVIFAVGFCTRDFASGFVKNTYVSSNKACYVLSKLVIIAIYTLVMYLWIVLLTVILIACAHPRVFEMPFYIYNPMNSFYHVDHWFWAELLKIGIAFASGAVVLAFACLCKIGFVVAVVSISYCFLSGWLYEGINAIVGNGFDIGHYTLMENSISLDVSTPTTQKLICLGVILGFSILGFFVAWLAYAKKNY